MVSVIVTRDSSFVSWGIRHITKSQVSHAILCPNELQVLEATFGGVVLRDFDPSRFTGHAWELVLRNEYQNKIVELGPRWIEECRSYIGRRYSWLGAIWSATPWIGPEKFDRMFCSDVVARLLEFAGVLPTLDSAEVTPDDLVKADLWSGVTQLTGDREELRGVGSVGLDKFKDYCEREEW